MDSIYQVADNLEIDWTEYPYSYSSSNAEEKSLSDFEEIESDIEMDYYKADHQSEPGSTTDEVSSQSDFEEIESDIEMDSYKADCLKRKKPIQLNVIIFYLISRKSSYSKSIEQLMSIFQFQCY